MVMNVSPLIKKINPLFKFLYGYRPIRSPKQNLSVKKLFILLQQDNYKKKYTCILKIKVIIIVIKKKLICYFFVLGWSLIICHSKCYFISEDREHMQIDDGALYIKNVLTSVKEKSLQTYLNKELHMQ